MQQYVIKERSNGTVIAYGEEGVSMHMLEGSWYFENVDMSLLRVTERTYTCPYKGVCYWIDLETPSGRAQNVGWVYPNPKRGYEHIKDLIGFYSHDTAGTIALRSAVPQNA
jgi:uncharacterized protein (DUF427 family)